MKRLYIRPIVDLQEMYTKDYVLVSGSVKVKGFEDRTITIGADDDNEVGANSMNTSLWEDE